jgi:predicted nucleic acid-binding protein
VSYLLDTCVLSEVVKPAPEEAVLRWLGAQDELKLYLSVLVLGEIQKGIEKLSPSRRRSRLESWLQDDLRQRFAGRIWGITDEIALTWGSFAARAKAQGQALPVIDGLLAATAQHHRVTLVTRNVAHFVGSGVRILDPWDGS